MVSALDSRSGGLRSSPGWGDIMLCSQARHFTLTVLLFTQVYKWVPANVLGVTMRWTCILSRGEQQYSQPLHAKETGVKHQPSWATWAHIKAHLLPSVLQKHMFRARQILFTSFFWPKHYLLINRFSIIVKSHL